MTFMAGSHDARHRNSRAGILLRVDLQPHPAPFDEVAFAGHQVFDGADAAAGSRRADVDVAEMEPKLPRPGLGQRHRNGDRVVVGGRFLDEADDLAVVDLREPQIAGLQQRSDCSAECD